jgi:hypothetical protein
MLTTKLVIFLVGGGAVIGGASTWVASDVMRPGQPCAVVVMQPQPQRPKEKPVGVEALGNFEELLKGKHK